jgi:ribonuclease D
MVPDSTFITNNKELDVVASRYQHAKELAIDTESNGMYVYHEHVCLIQLGTQDGNYIIDPLQISNLEPLGFLLSNPHISKVIHGSDYDLRCLDRDYGFNIKSIFDTQLAARFLGDTHPNLASVLEINLGVSISKSHHLQTSNWGLRPLSESAIDYAASDVNHLVQLAKVLKTSLSKLDRLSWVEEECKRLETIKYIVPDSAEIAFLKVKGSNKLNPKGLAVLKELFSWRDSQAQIDDIPPSRIIPNDTIIRLAIIATEIRSSDQTTIKKIIADEVETQSTMPRHRVRDITATILEAMAGPEFHRTDVKLETKVWTTKSREILKLLKLWRQNKSTELSLDPSLLWPSRSFERIALDTRVWEFEIDYSESSSVRAWQIKQFANEISAELSTFV